MTECMKVMNKEYSSQVTTLVQQMMILHEEQAKQRSFLESKISIHIESSASSVGPSTFVLGQMSESKIKIKSDSHKLPKPSSSTTSSQLSLLKPIRKPDTSDLSEMMSMASVLHHVVYYLHNLVNDMKKSMKTFKDANAHLFDHILHSPGHLHHNHTRVENSNNFVATHTPAEVMREYILEVFIMLFIAILLVILVSVLLLGVFFIFLWLVYNVRKVPEDLPHPREG